MIAPLFYGILYQMHKLGERTMASMTDSNWNELMTPLWALGIFPLFNAIWSEHGINDPLCQNWALGAFVLTDLSWNEPLPALESDCWCRFAQQRNLFLPTPSLTAFAQISRGPLFVQISGKYLEGFCLWFPETPPIIASDEVWCTDNVERLPALLQPRGSVRFAAVSWEKDHTALFQSRAFFLIFLNTELGSKNHMCFVYITREIRFLSNLEYCVFSENVLWK